MNITFVIIRLVLALICGGVVGYERTKRLKEAGIRTHCIICSASALLMMVSIYGFTGASGVTGTREADAARIASQVVSGISFLGAGVIFKNGSSVKGLTTAAGIWATAGIGLAIGGGMYLPGIALTLLVVFVQFFFHKFSVGSDVFAENDVELIAEGTDTFRESLKKNMENGEIQMTSMKVRRADGITEYVIRFRPKKEFGPDDIHALMEQFPEIKSISLT